jgi:hypothetical protein
MHSGPACCCTVPTPKSSFNILFASDELTSSPDGCHRALLRIAMTGSAALASGIGNLDGPRKPCPQMGVSSLRVPTVPCWHAPYLFACPRSFPSRIPSAWSCGPAAAAPARGVPVPQGRAGLFNAYFWWALGLQPHPHTVYAWRERLHFPMKTQ